MEQEPAAEKQPPKGKSRRRKTVGKIIGWMVLIWAVVCAVSLFIPVEIEVGYETTRIDGPLKADGTVDYVAALDEYYAAGVTPKNNAAMILVPLLRSEIERADITPVIARKLGLSEADMEAGPHFISRERFSESQANDEKDEGDDAEGDVPDSCDELSWDEPLSELDRSWVQANDTTLNRVVEAARLPRLYLPLVPLSPAEEDYLGLLAPSPMLPDLGVCRPATSALLLRARTRAEAGDVAAAWDDILAVHRLARLVAQHPSTVATLLGYALESQAATTACELAVRTPLTYPQALAMQRDLALLGPVGDLAEANDVGDRFFALNIVTAQSRGKKSPDSDLGDRFVRSFLDWNMILRDINTSHDALTVALGSDDYYQQQAAIQRIEKPFDEDWSSSTMAARTTLGLAAGPFGRGMRTQAYVELMSSILQPSMDYILVLCAEIKTEQDLEMLTLALAAYRADHARWPESLDALTPEYIPAVPNDRFNGEPLTYRTDGKEFLLYGAGENLRDDGGQSDTKADTDDIAVRTPGWDK